MLGEMAEDTSGLSGVIVAVCRYLSGTEMVLLQPPLAEGETLPAAQWRNLEEVHVIAPKDY